MAGELERLRAELAEARLLARLDPLTRAWNRRAIVELLERELERARRERGRVAVLFIDLDRFKRINDRHGHAAGDAVLCEAAARMRAVVRPYDAVGRYGGDEFVVIIAGTGAGRGAARAAAAVASGLRERPVATPAGEVRVTASIGVAVASAGARDPDRLIADADRAMYAAKRAGGDAVCDDPPS
ncbi:MAG: GGDEF domain-containing protein [Spirochaetaceae bacterium]|nr:GGDEF domain-containing protein [Spirochaetaceae bacterium]